MGAAGEYVKALLEVECEVSPADPEVNGGYVERRRVVGHVAGRVGVW